MRRIIGLSLSLMVLAGLCACGSGEAPQPAGSAQTEQSSIANPWTEYETIEEAEKESGILFGFPEIICAGQFSADTCFVMDDMMEVVYSGNAAALTIRQQSGEGQNISGDHTEYSVQSDSEAHGIAVEMMGDEERVIQSTFSYGGCSYSIYCESGLKEQDIQTMLGELTGDILPSESVTAAERFIDNEPVAPHLASGKYVGITYGECVLELYTSFDELPDEAGVITILDKDGRTVIKGKVYRIADNHYEIDGENADFTVFTDNGTVGLVLAVDGENADYFVMIE